MSGKIEVHDPRGFPPKVVGKRLANRLESLDGKIVYLVDCLFDNSDRFMEQLRLWLAEHMPSVIVRIIKPRESWVDDPEMRDKIAADGHAAITGVGNSKAPGVATVVGLALALERQGIPTVPVSTHVFARLAKATALAEGMPTARSVFVPQPVVGRSESELRAYIEGTDPVLKQPFMQGVIEGLTRPLSDEDYKGATFERSTQRFLEPDTEENLRAFIENRWTDYLPIILPTEERVEQMLRGTKHAADKIVGRLRPTAFREYWEFNVEKVAVNAVMAGARPQTCRSSSRWLRAARPRAPAAPRPSRRSRSSMVRSATRSA